MKLLTKSIYEQLLRNGRVSAERNETGQTDADFTPVVKLFTPDGDIGTRVRARPPRAAGRA